MAWWDLYRATGDTAFRELYQESIEPALSNSASFFPDGASRPKPWIACTPTCIFWKA